MYIYDITGPDPQTDGALYMCGGYSFSTQHQANQKVVLTTVNMWSMMLLLGGWGMSNIKFSKLHTLRLNLRTFSRICRGNSYISCIDILYLVIYNYLSTSKSGNFTSTI